MGSKKRRIGLLLLGLVFVFACSDLTGGRLFPDEDVEENEEFWETVTPEITETPDPPTPTETPFPTYYRSDLPADELQAFYDRLLNLPADEFNQLITQEMENLPDAEQADFLAWLKESYLVTTGCSSENWQLPMEFSISPSADWAAGVPKPQQGTLMVFSMGSDLVQMTINNMTYAAYQAWVAQFDAGWASANGLTSVPAEDLDAKKALAEERTREKLGPRSKTATEILAETGRDAPTSIIFVDEQMTKWLEVAYGQNMAVLTYQGDFSQSVGTSSPAPQTEDQKIMQGSLDKFAIVELPAARVGKLVTHSEGETESGYSAQILRFEDFDPDEWNDILLTDSWKNVGDMPETEDAEWGFEPVFSLDSASALDFDGDTSQTYYTKKVDGQTHILWVMSDEVGNTVVTINILP